MTAEELLAQLRRVAFCGTLTINALAVLFPHTFYDRQHSGDKFPSGRQFILGMHENYTPDFGQMAGEIVLISIVGLFIVFALTAFIRKA
jgi:hypothetical protein